MQTQQGNNKTIWIVLIVIVVGAAAYYLYPSSKETSTNAGGNLGTSIPGGPPGLVSDPDDPNADILPIVNSLQNIHLDETFFSDPIIASFVDRTINITPEPIGRHDPFAPAFASEVTDSASVASAPVIKAPSKSIKKK